MVLTAAGMACQAEELEVRDWGVTKWTDGQKTRQAVLAGLIWTDIQQTKQCLRTDPRCYEQNPILGRRPSSGRLNVYGILAFAGLTLMVDQLDDPNRSSLQWGLIAIEGYAVADARSRGWKPNLPLFGLRLVL